MDPDTVSPPPVTEEPAPTATSDAAGEEAAAAPEPGVGELGATVGDRDEPRQDPTPELERLVQLTVRYPEIGPVVAELAFKIGQAGIGGQILRMGLERQPPALEYYFVAANVARREHRTEEVLARCLEAVRAFAAGDDAAADPDDGTRLLHLVRLGFTTLLFDLHDVSAGTAFTAALADELPRLEARLGGEPFYHTLLAQALWHRDRAASEREWDRAAELGDPELTWNARGTWYKEAEHDLERAIRAYRQGLETAPHSALVRHNLAQALIENAGAPASSPDAARRLVREADLLLQAALREDCAKGLRRHIHGTRDRLRQLRGSLPPASRDEAPRAPEPPRPPPEAGQVVVGHVASIMVYGCFVSLGGGVSGLLHKTEMAHEPIDDPARVVKIGDEIEVKVLEVGEENGRPRIRLSRRAILPPPPPGARPQPRPRDDYRGPDRSREARPREADRGPNRSREAAAGPTEVPKRSEADRPRRDDRDRPRGPKEPFVKVPTDGRLASLGEMLLAKLKEQAGK